MPIRPPALDDRRFQDLVDEALAQAHVPEWTPRVGDPGQTIVELFAWLVDTLLYRANLVPEKQRLQFLRLLAWARERSGACVVLEVNAHCHALAERGGGFDQIIRAGTLPPAFDFHCELMSLPLALGLRLSDLPVSTAYLRADPPRVAHWRKRLAALPRPWVGLVWAGRPSHPNDARRSLALAELAPCSRVVPCQIESALRRTDRQRRGQAALNVEPAHHDGNAFILGADEVFRGNDAVLKHQFPKRAAAEAHLVQLLRH